MDATLPHAETEKPWRIDIRLPRLSELFNALDPSPLVERDIDDRVEAFIVDSASDAPSHAPLALVITAPDAGGEIPHEDIGAAVRTYFAYLRDAHLQRTRRLMREGRAALVLGLGFLVVCTALGQVVLTLAPEPWGGVVQEGLLIIGWVANWRPVEIFLYDWRPMRRRARLYDRLSRMEVTVKA